VREAILLAIAHPAVAVVCLTLGWAGVVAEFLFPGKVLPGALGGVLTLLTLRSLLPQHAKLATAVATPLVLITLGLARFALRARKHKLEEFTDSPGEPR